MISWTAVIIIRRWSFSVKITFTACLILLALPQIRNHELKVLFIFCGCVCTINYIFSFNSRYLIVWCILVILGRWYIVKILQILTRSQKVSTSINSSSWSRLFMNRQSPPQVIVIVTAFISISSWVVTFIRTTYLYFLL